MYDSLLVDDMDILPIRLTYNLLGMPLGVDTWVNSRPLRRIIIYGYQDLFRERFPKWSSSPISPKDLDELPLKNYPCIFISLVLRFWCTSSIACDLRCKAAHQRLRRCQRWVTKAYPTLTYIHPSPLFLCSSSNSPSIHEDRATRVRLCEKSILDIIFFFKRSWLNQGPHWYKIEPRPTLGQLESLLLEVSS